MIYVLVSLNLEKPIPELTDLIAGRVYSMSGVKQDASLTATIVDPEKASELLKEVV